ncbi:cytochrome P450 [Aspergillus homomorphus CBS 101889]|uniref:Cytochrome P450 n=1 Tax=Aspergillus homomorphus (strain CBS 101889) TaxID=1450537 RepID=A0A395HHQ6_ASPHC|nr:cytochrome P450 [Aspergillus homomorphus CBS 101889]RAL07029.1 cytochrome P450 [Aspergillus homomorphus CBS 101889]
MLSTFVICVLLLLFGSVFLRMVLDYTQDSREPPPVDLSMPFIGPILRMGWTGFDYYRKHRSQFPIYTIRLPGIRLYVVNSTSLISAVQHHPRTLSFSPILARVAATLIGASDSGCKVLGDDEENGFIRRFHDFNLSNLSTGPGLEVIRTSFWELVTSSQSRQFVESPGFTGLYQWISHEVIMATSQSMYGAQSPFRDPATRTAWKKYQSGATRLTTGCIPSIIARQALRARERVVRSFEQYYRERGFEHEEASPYINDQYHIFSKSGLSDADIAKTQAAFSIALLGNTIPATFWLVYHIFSSQTILHDCRKELDAALLQAGRRDSDGRPTLDLMSLERACPILASTFKETLRTHSMGTSVTQVIEDQVIDGRYLFKKGAMVLIPAIIQHSDPTVWGDDVHSFDHRRFVRDNIGNDRKGSHNPVGFRVFGGGRTLCPGRHVATSMILGFAASTILNFDLQPRRGQWVMPTVKNSPLGVAIAQPDEDFDVEFRCRKTEGKMSA